MRIGCSRDVLSPNRLTFLGTGKNCAARGVAVEIAVIVADLVISLLEHGRGRRPSLPELVVRRRNLESLYLFLIVVRTNKEMASCSWFYGGEFKAGIKSDVDIFRLWSVVDGTRH